MNQHNIEKKIDKAKQRQAKYYNRETKELDELKNGDIKRIQQNPGNNEWKRGTVKEKVNIRSYEINIGPRTICRNRRYLRKSHEEPTNDQHHNMDIDIDELVIPTTENSDHENIKTTPANTKIKSSQTVTRSERVVKTPKYLSEYIQDW